MQRYLAALALLGLASPAAAWEFTQDTLCRLSHDEGGVAVDVTYDPAVPEYAIHVRRDAPWPASPVFAMIFEGGRALSISTDRHRLSEDGRTLSVHDSGFGNVLNGLQYNSRVTALVLDSGVTVSLAGAAPEVERFRGCATARLS
ncbi:hypothetical protein [Ovoidimarina sediminis]|uniref:hypothetical protein n=1 Tax=Ovoidimarina sediminis TaxID=3079856 RepID=UPI0029093086|nr:hypothetical protein [Rhodophyticola sp. MJ-SS7]MDU8943468.1 hypothetical protein [Rhodophyticola sp. MJ-SS7]